MTNPHHAGNETARRSATEEEIWLLGQPSLWQYLEFIKDSVVGGTDIDPAHAAAEWRTANKYYETLEHSESGIADTAECTPLPSRLSSLTAQVTDHPTFRKTHDTLPTEFGMVELDKLVVCQQSVTWTYVDVLTARLGVKPSPKALFQLCMPLDKPEAPVRGQAMGEHRFVFRSPSADFRFQEAALLRPEHMSGYTSFGPVAGMVGVSVGFGSKFLSVIKVGNRLLLHNGYHRACAMRALGVTHAPCVITPVATHDELEVTAKSSVVKNPDFYFKSHRPPLLRDYFDQKIRKSLTIHKLVRIVEVHIEVKEYLVPE